jgi:hypothetical protein
VPLKNPLSVKFQIFVSIAIAETSMRKYLKESSTGISLKICRMIVLPIALNMVTLLKMSNKILLEKFTSDQELFVSKTLYSSRRTRPSKRRRDAPSTCHQEINSTEVPNVVAMETERNSTC